MKVALVPNDDGYGPSALGYYIAKALLRREERHPEEQHSIVIRNKSALTLNASFYEDQISEGRVSLQPTFGGIQMQKKAGGVDIPATLRDIQHYPERSGAYRIPQDVDAVIDIGTPAAVRAAHAAKKPAFTVSDHAWGMTYEKTLDNLIDSFISTLGVSGEEEFDDIRAAMLQCAGIRNSPVMKAIERIKQDESETWAVFLFEEYITSKDFHDHWKGRLPDPEERVVPITGVFGGNEDRLVSREAALKRMGISEGTNRKTVYILGGGTPVWDAKLAEIISHLRDKVLEYNVVLFDRNAKPNAPEKLGDSLYTVGAVRGETVQGLLPGVDLIITRGGGGIANDAIACRVPFVCVEEPGHWQVEMIRKNCEREGLTRTIPFKQFEEGDITHLIDDQLIGHEADNKEIREKMNDIENGKEDAVAEQIVDWCSSAQHHGRSG